MSRVPRPIFNSRKYALLQQERSFRSIRGVENASGRTESSTSAARDKMYAVAEVYETDILHVKVGQNARIKSPALSQPLTGTVEQIGRWVGKLDLLSTDPTARTDARVVEVKVRLDDSKAVAGLTNLQVTVEIDR